MYTDEFEGRKSFGYFYCDCKSGGYLHMQIQITFNNARNAKKKYILNSCGKTIEHKTRKKVIKILNHS